MEGRKPDEGWATDTDMDLIQRLYHPESGVKFAGAGPSHTNGCPCPLCWLRVLAEIDRRVRFDRSATLLIAELARCEVELEANGEALAVTCRPYQFTPALRALLQDYKPELIAALFRPKPRPDPEREAWERRQRENAAAYFIPGTKIQVTDRRRFR